MSRLFYHVMQDNAGNLLFDVSGTMRIAGTGTLATIYGDEELTVILPNPMTNHPSYGSFKCFLGVGDYDFYMAKAGYTFETLTGLQGLGTMADLNSPLPIANGGTAATTAATARTNLGLGTMADLNSPLPIANGGTAATTAATARTNLGLGTMATQNSGTVAITGGTVTGLAGLGVTGASTVTVAQAISAARLFAVEAVSGDRRIGVFYDRTAEHGIVLRPNQDTGNYAIFFQNQASAAVGGISSSGVGTTYGTTSDARLKHDVAPLTGALDVVRRLRPVAFKWRSDDSPGRGFLAQEVAEVVDGVITGERDEVNPDGTMKPQMIDHSKLVVYLVGACKELAAQVEALTARLEACGG